MAEAATKRTTKPKDQGGAAVVPLRPDGPTLTIRGEQEWWTPAQQAALEAIGLKDCPDADRMAFLHLCQATGLDPFRREIYLIGRKDSDMPSGKRWTAQTGIDGFRHLAEETGVYGGRIGPQWCGTDGEWHDVWLGEGPPVAARCGVIRTDIRDGDGNPKVTWGTCLYREFVPLTEVWEGPKNQRRPVKNEDGTTKTKPMGLWGKMPAHQLGKCSEAQAVRATFPRKAAGLYEQAEMDQADARSAQAERRDRIREEMSSRPWRKEGGDPEPVDVIDGQLVAVPPREALDAELADQAQILGKSVAQHATRWAAAHHKNIGDATDAEMWDFLLSRRDAVAQKAAETGVEPVLAAAPEPDPASGSATSDEGPKPEAPADGAPVEVGEGQGELLPDPTAETLPRHPFVEPDDGGDRCAVEGCGRYLDDAEAH